MENRTILSKQASKGLLCDLINDVKIEYCKFKHLSEEVSGRCFCCLKFGYLFNKGG